MAGQVRLHCFVEISKAAVGGAPRRICLNVTRAVDNPGSRARFASGPPRGAPVGEASVLIRDIGTNPLALRTLIDAVRAAKAGLHFFGSGGLFGSLSPRLG